MPVAHIHVLKGHSRQALRSIITDVAEAMGRILRAPKERFMVWVTEVDPELWGVEGRPASDALAEKDRAAVEIPFVQIVLMEGRPLAQYHAVIEEVSAVIARSLNSDKSRVRVHLIQAQPDFWGIGGVPYSVLRADEVAERARATA